MKLTGLFLLALIGAVVATLCDANHAFTQTLSYPDPFIGLQAWWVFPGFFLAFGFMGITYLLLGRALKSNMAIEESLARGNIPALVEAMATFAFAYLISGFGNEHHALLSALFFGTFFIRFVVTYEKVWLLIVAIILAIGGMFFEGLLAHFGLVAYRHADIFYVPLWLGGLYMHGAFALREGARLFLTDDGK